MRFRICESNDRTFEIDVQVSSCSHSLMLEELKLIDKTSELELFAPTPSLNSKFYERRLNIDRSICVECIALIYRPNYISQINKY